MSWRDHIAGSLICLITVCNITVAQGGVPSRLGLDISSDQLLLDSKQSALEFGVEYTSVAHKSSRARYQSFLTQSGQIIDIPVNFANVDQERQTIIGNLGLRHGLTSKTELSGSLTIIYKNVYGYSDADRGTFKSSETQFNDLSVLLSRQIIGETGYPALIGFIEVPVVQNLAQVGTQTGFVKAVTFGGTVYSPSDPLLLMLTGGFKYRDTRKIQGERLNPGNSIFFSPSVFFAVNNDVTLSGGISAQFTSRDKINKVDSKRPRTQADALFGLSLGLSEKLNINFETKFRVFGEESFGFGVNISRKLKLK